MTNSKTLEQLQTMVQNFCEERDWDQFHGAKDLAIGAVTEASELLEPFRFQTEEQVESMMKDESRREAIGEELADVLFFLLRFSQRYDFDLTDCFTKKMEKNSNKYPADQFKGQNYKSKL